ncbi:MAG: hypothetical protein JRJ39_08440 [Deltaproteobacteria bacterium]|nr:hypothetical protein [Deltaproteobacteria bacterium]
MVKSKPVIIVLSVIGIVLFFFFFQSEERQVRKRFKTFAQTASKRVEDSQLIVAGTLNHARLKHKNIMCLETTPRQIFTQLRFKSLRGIQN